MELSGKVAIVTGASRGIGVVIAERLAEKGSSLALVARSEADLKETANRIQSKGVRAIAIAADVTQRDDLEKIVTRTEQELGPPDILVNNAGIETLAHFETLPLDEIESVIATNVTALVSLTRVVTPGMIERGRGHIVNISSTAGKTAAPFYTVYSASKHAVVGFSWSLRAELRDRGVAVSVVCPPYVADTGMFNDRGQTPPKMLGTVTADDVANAVVRAIESNKAEIVIGKLLFRVADVASAISPELPIAIGRRSGSYDFIQSMIPELDD